MVTESQAAHVMALVKERHVTVTQAFENLLNAYAVGDQARIVSTNDNLRKALHDLSGVVAKAHERNATRFQFSDGIHQVA